MCSRGGRSLGGEGGTVFVVLVGVEELLVGEAGEGQELVVEDALVGLGH